MLSKWPQNSGGPTPAASVAAVPPSYRSYIPSLIPPGVDPAKVDSNMIYNYVPNTIKLRKRTTAAQREVLEDVFVTDKKPNALRRKELAKELEISPREVQVCPNIFCPLKPKSFAHPHPINVGLVSEQACQREDSQCENPFKRLFPCFWPRLYCSRPSCRVFIVECLLRHPRRPCSIFIS